MEERPFLRQALALYFQGFPYPPGLLGTISKLTEQELRCKLVITSVREVHRARQTRTWSVGGSQNLQFLTVDPCQYRARCSRSTRSARPSSSFFATSDSGAASGRSRRRFVTGAEVAVDRGRCRRISEYKDKVAASLDAPDALSPRRPVRNALGIYFHQLTKGLRQGATFRLA